MGIEFEQLEPYLDSLIPERPSELQKMEAYAEVHNFPILGPASGHLCYQLTRMMNAKRVFELGSGYGYSTAWFARGVQENKGGEVHHSVYDPQLTRMAQTHLSNMGYNEIVHFHTGESVEELSKTSGQFDLIFNDIDKDAYPESLPVIAKKLRPGGLLIIDNMLWYGAVWDENDLQPSTMGVRSTVHHLTKSVDWISSLLPIRDGLIIAFRK